MQHSQPSPHLSGPLTDLGETGVLAILRDPILSAASIANALVEVGIRHVEVSLSSQNSVRTLKAVRAEVGDRAVIGVGSVLRSSDLEASVAEGARFAVAPNASEEIFATARSLGIPLIPGALTPTEILECFDRGAGLVKVFPVDAVGGPGYIRSVRAPAPDLQLLPVGGVDADNIADYAAAGAAAVGIGSALSRFDDLGRLSSYAEGLVHSWKAKVDFS